MHIVSCVTHLSPIPQKVSATPHSAKYRSICINLLGYTVTRWCFKWIHYSTELFVVYLLLQSNISLLCFNMYGVICEGYLSDVSL